MLKFSIYLNEWKPSFLVSTYVVCERLSVMQQPARLPENFDQILAEHPCSGIWYRIPPASPEMKNSNFLSWLQIWAYTEHPPPPWKWKTLTFFPEFRSELTQNTTPLPPPKWKTLTFFPEFRSELTQNTSPPPGPVEVCGDCIPQGYHLVQSCVRVIQLRILSFAKICTNLPIILNAYSNQPNLLLSGILMLGNLFLLTQCSGGSRIYRSRGANLCIFSENLWN